MIAKARSNLTEPISKMKAGGINARQWPVGTTFEMRSRSTSGSPSSAPLVALAGTVIGLALGLKAGAAMAACFEALGGLQPSSDWSEARGVSADGDKVVGHSDYSVGWGAFLYSSEAGTMTYLGELPGDPLNSRAVRISKDQSTIVGYSQVESGVGGYRAFRWTQATGMLMLDGLPGVNGFSQAFDVSADGSVIVGIASDGVRTQGFVWSEAAGMQTLGNLPGGASNSAWAVSGDGAIVVGSEPIMAVETPFMWTASEGLRTLFDVAGEPAWEGSPYDITDDGTTIAGTRQLEVGWEAFRWTPEGGVEGLGSIGGSGAYSSGYAISDDGEVVVGRSYHAEGDKAFFWRESLGMVSIADHLAANCAVDLTGWELTQASDVSADGRVVVGTGINPQGDVEAWRAVLEPEAVPLLSVAGRLGVAFFLVASAFATIRARARLGVVKTGA